MRCEKCNVQNLECKWRPSVEGKQPNQLVSSKPMEKEIEESSKQCIERLGNENRGLKQFLFHLGTNVSHLTTEISTHGFDSISSEQALLALGSSQTDATSKPDTPVAASTEQVKLPYTPFAAEDTNMDGATEQGSQSTWKKKVKWDLNHFKSRQKRTDPPTRSDMATNDFSPEKSDSPGYGPSSNVQGNPVRASVFGLSQVPQNVRLQPQQAHPKTATVYESLEAKIIPLSSTSSSASCDTPSDSDVESLASNTTDGLDYETDPADIDPSPEVVPEQKVTELKQSIVDRIMKDFCSTFYCSQGIRVCPEDRGNGCDGNRSSRYACDHVPSTQRHTVQALLRGTEGQRGKFGDGEDNDRNRDPRSNSDTPAEASDAPGLACPFYKRDPFIHSNSRSCRGPGWQTVARVK